MLALKQALSLVSTGNFNTAWTPNDDTSVVAWWQNQVGITSALGKVTNWADSSGNDRDMVQASSAEQPDYAEDTGNITFVSANNENLQTIVQISLADDFTIGIRCFPTAFSNTLIADNTTTNEFFKFTSSSNLRIKIDGSTANMGLDSGTFGDDYLVISRDSDVITLWKNGVAQSSTATLAGTTDIDAIGIRKTDVNGFDGTIKEVQIYSSASAALTANVNTRLSLL